MRDRFITAAIAASALLAGCSGGGGGSSPMQTPATQSPATSSPSQGSQAQSEAVVSDANAVGSPLKNFADFDKSIDTSTVSGIGSSARTRDVASGTCNNGVEFFAPDQNGDADSTETIDFYDSACSEKARDIVRVYAPTSASSETVAVTESLFAPGNPTAIATQTDQHTITNATFNKYGYPEAAAGFDLVQSDTLTIAEAKTISSGSELVMQPASSGTNAFCSDSSGFNDTGIAKLNETFGWQGGVLSGGSRTVNSDNSVTWTATHAGTTFKGAIGALSIATGTQNTACPIATPMFTLAGGTSTGTYSIPVVATYLHGMLESLTITNATLSNGTTLSVATNSALPPSSAGYITGTIGRGTTQIATFAVDAFGDGTLTLTATGAQYVITDWHVVR